MEYQEATDVSRSLSKTQIADEVSNAIPTKLILRFVVLIYDGTSANKDANAARKAMFKQKGQSLENIPPTSLLGKMSSVESCAVFSK